MGRRKAKREAGQTSETREMTETQRKSEIDQKTDHVKKMIEKCLMLHMNKKQTVETLRKVKVDDVFTETVWEGLQQDNPSFFTLYHVRLVLKEQIAVFNMLLGKQANSMGILRKSVCNRCGTALLHQWGASYVRCAKCFTIFSVTPQEKVSEHATGHASTSLAAQCIPSNANPLSSIKYGRSSENPNIQVGAGALFPPERMGIPGRIPEHATGHASTSLATKYMNANPLSAIKYGGPSGNPNVQIGAGDLFPSESMGIRGIIPDHVTGHASTSFAEQCMPSNENPLSANKYGGSSGNPNIQFGAGDLFPADRMDITVKIPEHATGHASTSLAAQYLPSNANPVSAIKYGGSSGNPNIQVGACDLFPAERMGIPGKIPEHETEHASTYLAAENVPSNANSLSAIKYGVSSGHPNIHVGADAMFPAGRLCISADILETETSRMQVSHEVTGTGNKSYPSFMRNSGSGGDDLLAIYSSTGDADGVSLGAMKYGVSLGHPNIHVGADAVFSAGRLCISADIPETETSRMQISHEVTGTANKSYPSFMRNSGSGGDGLLAIHSSTGDADGASSNQFEMSGKPSTELPLDADTSFRYSVSQNLADILPDVGEPLFGLSAFDKLSECLLKYDTDQSGSPDQIPELFSSSDEQYFMVDHPSTPPRTDYVPDTDDSLRSIIHRLPPGNPKVQLGTGEFIPTGSSNGSTSIQAKENAKTGNFQAAANKTVPRSPSNQDILFPPGDNFLRKAPSTGDPPRPSLDYWEQTGQPFSESHSGVDTVACDTLNKNPLSFSFTKSTCADDGRVGNNREGISYDDFGSRSE